MRTTRIIVVLAVLAVAGFSMRSHSQQQPPLQNVMEAKLKHAQNVLQGLALEDFKKIEQNAAALSALSQADSWNVHQTPEYIRFSEEFRRTADALVADARAKRLEACTLDYVQMTMVCVNCHSHTRKIGIAAADEGDLLASLRGQ